MRKILLRTLLGLTLSITLFSCEKNDNCGEISFSLNSGVSNQFRQECCPNTYHWPVVQQLEINGTMYDAEGHIDMFVDTEVHNINVNAQYWEGGRGVVLWIDGVYHYTQAKRIENLIGSRICL